MILAFDTSGSVGSVVVARGGDVLARRRLERQAGHAALLVPTIASVLDDAGVNRDELTDLVVGEGPGSFTGVRVAAATAKGLARSLGLRLWPVSSLAGAAMSVEEGAVRYALFDARAQRVYGACFGVGGARVSTLIAPHAGELADVLDGDLPNGAVFLGDAAERHRPAIEAAGHTVVTPPTHLTHADGLVRYWAARPDVLAPIADLGGWEPAYVRASSAERLWG